MGIEYLVLSIQSNPGRSQRWHLRRLHQYKHGTEDWHNGGSNCAYFTNKIYRNVLWTDVSPKEVKYGCCSPVVGWPAMKSKSAQMHLTRRGLSRANRIREKLGLAPVEWSSYEFPIHQARAIYQTGA